MKIRKSLYNIMQYISTYEEVFVYNNNGVFTARDKIGSGFVEVAVDNFINEQLVIRNFPRFLKLFTFNKPVKGENPDVESVQDFIVEDIADTKTGITSKQILLKSKGRTIKVKQGSSHFIQKRSALIVPRANQIVIKDPVKFQMSSDLYKQILSDCSLLDLNMINFKSVDNKTIKIFLTKENMDLSEDYSSYEIECDHEHSNVSIAITLPTFALIDAPDHQIEFGLFCSPTGASCSVLKVKSFYNGYIVNKVIAGEEGGIK